MQVFDIFNISRMAYLGLSATFPAAFAEDLCIPVAADSRNSCAQGGVFLNRSLTCVR